MQYKRWQKVLVLVAPFAAAAVCIAAAYLILRYVTLWPCPSLALFHIYCPGCGSGRALYSLMHGDWRGAFRHNCLFLPIGVPAVLVFLHEFLRVTIPSLQLKPVYIPQWLSVGCCALLFLFWLLRNLPAFAFLAP